MNYQTFKQLLLLYKKGQSNIHELGLVGVDLLESPYEMSSIVEKMMNLTLGCFYTEEGLEWVSWFIFDNDWGKRNWRGPLYERDAEGKLVKKECSKDGHGAHDEHGNPICYSIKSLHAHLQQNHLKL